jgi:DNA mismatch endonuclease Vsr
MSSVKSRGNVSTELKMLSLLRANKLSGWRRHANITGKPDFSWFKKKIALFVDGCFWHKCPHCFRGPKSNLAYWKRKIGLNRKRDLNVNKYLRSMGWTVIRVWECQISRQETIMRIRKALHEYVNSSNWPTTAERNNYKLAEYELDIQFRCSGSDAFVNWVNNTLGIKRTANVLWNQKEEFDFKIFDSPEALEEEIRKKAAQGSTARMTAGFCWPWSDPDDRGILRNDVSIGKYQRPWNAKPEAKKLAAGIPVSNLWAYDPNGLNQVGCVYTAQGFEFDYVGVIFGSGLVYNFENQSWEGKLENSADQIVKRSKEDFVKLVKNTYRVLLSRGMKGCYVYFVDKETEKFIKSRIEWADEAGGGRASPASLWRNDRREAGYAPHWYRRYSVRIFSLYRDWSIWKQWGRK